MPGRLKPDGHYGMQKKHCKRCITNALLLRRYKTNDCVVNKLNHDIITSFEFFKTKNALIHFNSLLFTARYPNRLLAWKHSSALDCHWHLSVQQCASWYLLSQQWHPKQRHQLLKEASLLEVAQRRMLQKLNLVLQIA